MHRRHQPANIPTEIMRTLEAIAETGNFSRAGEKLNLSQPAISAQVKRLQMLVGGPVFHKPATGGIDFTPLGRLVLAHARRLLEANDQILSLGGSARDGQPIRLGISAFYAEMFLEQMTNGGLPPLYIHCDRSAELVRGLDEGYYDVICALSGLHRGSEPEFAWPEEIVWARRPDFVMSPGMPVPLVVWPGNFDEMSPVEAMERDGVSYRIVFSSADLQARLAAVTSGVGLMVLPRRLLRKPLVAAYDYYLPKLRPAHTRIELRRGFEADGLDTLLAVLRSLAPEGMATAEHTPKFSDLNERSVRTTA